MESIVQDASDVTSPPLKVALCQVYTEQWAVEENTRRTLASLDEAADLGADLAITPECVLHGYAERCEDFEGRMREAAAPLESPVIDSVREKAKSRQLDVVLGFAEARPGGSFANSAALITRDGNIVCVYRKVHCRPFEDANRDGLFTPGDDFLVADFAGHGGANVLGIMICFDREVTESVRCLRALGAEIIACPLATDTTDMTNHGNCADNEMITRIRAAENEVFIVVVNHAGRFNGGSFAVGPGGELIQQMGVESGVEVLELPIGVVPEKYHNKPLGWLGWGYRRAAIYEKYLRSPRS
jgi:predicted amidohydrolase